MPNKQTKVTNTAKSLVLESIRGMVQLLQDELPSYAALVVCDESEHTEEETAAAMHSLIEEGVLVVNEEGWVRMANSSN